MSPPTHRVSFADPRFRPLQLPDGAQLSEHLDVSNSPVLFGCRTGLCGTCRSVVEGALPPPDADEQEVLDIAADHPPGARLLCQVRLRSDLHVVACLGPG